MCGRIAHFRSQEKYLKWLKSQEPVSGPVNQQMAERYNVAPQTDLPLLHHDSDGLRFTTLRWGFVPRWASGQPSINARLETAATSRYWADIWSAGRCLLPADGWFEWVSDPRQPRARQPYFIRLKRDEPMFFAAVGRFTRGPDAIQPEDAGFAIVTADSEGGMIDVHDRRPVVLPADAARKWLAPHVSPAEAEDLACRHATPVDAFQWYEVDPAVGDVRSEGRQLIEPRPPIPSTMDMFDG